MGNTTDKRPHFTLADRLTKARHCAGLSQNEMAYRLEYTRRTLSEWERGHRSPRIAIIREWALICGVDAEWLLEGMLEATS